MANLTVLSTKWSDSTPWVRTRASDSSHSELRPAIGLRLNYRATPESPRVCLGHSPFRRSGDTGEKPPFYDCSKQPEPGSRRCQRCNIVEATFAANLHHAHTRGNAELDPAIREHLRQPNQLYLAAFRDGSIKIGTSTLGRQQERFEEQGAWKAHIVASTSDGIAVRDIEDRVTEELGLRQAVNASRKLAGMVDPIADQKLLGLLDRHRTAVAELIVRMGDSRVEHADVAWENPVAGDQVWRNLYKYPLKPAAGAHDLEIVAVLGRIAAVRRPGPGTDVFAVDLQELYGIELELGDFESDEIAIQDSLF